MCGPIIKSIAFVLISGALTGWARTGRAGTPTGMVLHLHNVHVTRGRLIIEGSAAVARISFFRHDLDAALAAFANDPSFSVTSSSATDSLFLAYFNGRFSMVVDADTLRPAITSSGEGDDSWWYELQFLASKPISSLSLRNETLFEIYSNQKHFMRVKFHPSGKTERLYFVRGAAKHILTIG